MRRMKEPEVRKSEILDAAQKLFIEKGYNKTTVIDILNVHGLSKGVFYYYFKSKEEVMDAIIDRIIDAETANVKKIIADPDMTPQQKLCAVLLGHGQSEEVTMDKKYIIEEFHKPQNAEMHQKSLVQTVKRLAPVMVEIFNNEAASGNIKTDYPVETISLLLAAGQFIFDEALFERSPEERARYAAAFVDMIERTLGVPQGYFDEVKKLFAM